MIVTVVVIFVAMAIIVAADDLCGCVFVDVHFSNPIDSLLQAFSLCDDSINFVFYSIYFYFVFL